MNIARGKHARGISIFKPKGKHAKGYSNIEITRKMFTHLTIIILICLVSGTSAYLIIKFGIQNMFTIGEVKPEIIETFDTENKTKSDVYVKNSGNVPIYLRVAIIISWKDAQGKILETIPEENIDYSIDFSTSPNWMKSSDGYYYYENILEENENTNILVEECVQIKEYDNRILEVSFGVQAIQAEPSKAVEEAWNVKIADGKLVLN